MQKCSRCSFQCRTGIQLAKHNRVVHGPIAIQPVRLIAQRTEAGNDHAAARPSEADARGNAAAAASGCDDQHDSSAAYAPDAGEYHCPDGGDEEQDAGAGSPSLITREGFEALKKQLQEASYSLDLEVGARKSNAKMRGRP